MRLIIPSANPGSDPFSDIDDTFVVFDYASERAATSEQGTALAAAVQLGQPLSELPEAEQRVLTGSSLSHVLADAMPGKFSGW